MFIGALHYIFRVPNSRLLPLVCVFLCFRNILDLALLELIPRVCGGVAVVCDMVVFCIMEDLMVVACLHQYSTMPLFSMSNERRPPTSFWHFEVLP